VTVVYEARIEVGKHYALPPSPQDSVGDGAVIHLDRGRQLNLVVDGTERATWVRAGTVGEALQQLGMSDMVAQKDAKLSTPMSGQIPLDGMTLRVKTLKHVTLFDGANRSEER